MLKCDFTSSVIKVMAKIRNAMQGKDESKEDVRVIFTTYVIFSRLLLFVVHCPAKLWFLFRLYCSDTQTPHSMLSVKIIGLEANRAERSVRKLVGESDRFSIHVSFDQHGSRVLRFAEIKSRSMTVKFSLCASVNMQCREKLRL